MLSKYEISLQKSSIVLCQRPHSCEVNNRRHKFHLFCFEGKPYQAWEMHRRVVRLERLHQHLQGQAGVQLWWTLSSWQQLRKRQQRRRRRRWWRRQWQKLFRLGRQRTDQRRLKSCEKFNSADHFLCCCHHFILCSKRVGMKNKNEFFVTCFNLAFNPSLGPLHINILVSLSELQPS